MRFSVVITGLADVCFVPLSARKSCYHVVRSLRQQRPLCSPDRRLLPTFYMYLRRSKYVGTFIPGVRPDVLVIFYLLSFVVLQFKTKTSVCRLAATLPFVDFFPQAASRKAKNRRCKRLEHGIEPLHIPNVTKDSAGSLVLASGWRVVHIFRAEFTRNQETGLASRINRAGAGWFPLTSHFTEWKVCSCVTSLKMVEYMKIQWIYILLHGWFQPMLTVFFSLSLCLSGYIQVKWRIVLIATVASLSHLITDGEHLF